MQLTPSPSKPGLQAQLKLPTVSVQRALLLQLSRPSSHSSMSAMKTNHSFQQDQLSLQLRILVQLTPSPSKPGLQLQLKLPTVSLQVALSLQLSTPRSHSSMSRSNNGTTLNSSSKLSLGGKNYSFLSSLTCAVDSISLKARVAVATEASNSVSASGILIAIACPEFTFINVYKRGPH